MRVLLTVCFCMLLSACAEPLSSAVNMTLSGVSYFFTGKTTTDHGLSLVLQEDCELLRILEGEVCRSETNGYLRADLEVALEPLQGDTSLAGVTFVRPDGSPAAPDTLLAEEEQPGGTSDRSPAATQSAVRPLSVLVPLNAPGDSDASIFGKPARYLRSR